MKPYLLLPALGLVACAGQHPAPADTISAQQTEALPDSAAFRDPSRVHTYLINDYIDPNNPRLLHRGHPVEVIEQDETWNLNASESTDENNVPVALASDPSAAPNPYSAEFETELAQQRDQYRQLAAMGSQMNAQMDRLAQMAGKEAEAVSENAVLRDRLESLQREIDELKPSTRPPVSPDAPRKRSWFAWIWDLFWPVPKVTPVTTPLFVTNLVLRPAEMPAPPSVTQPSAGPTPTTLPSAGPPTNAPDESEVSVPSPGQMAKPENHNP